MGHVRLSNRFSSRSTCCRRILGLNLKLLLFRQLLSPGFKLGIERDLLVKGNSQASSMFSKRGVFVTPQKWKRLVDSQPILFILVCDCTFAFVCEAVQQMIPHLNLQSRQSLEFFSRDSDLTCVRWHLVVYTGIQDMNPN